MDIDTSKPAAVQHDLKLDKLRRVVCRYGRGCTHLQDPVHRERFWHPPIAQLTDEIVRSNYICNECGAPFRDLTELQLHLQRKTAWSNQSLVGCRISCLVDYKEWHEGVVSQFHKSGKHFVEFRQIGEKRWLNMKKIAFYIVERPLPLVNFSGEQKDEGTVYSEANLAPLESTWIYVEDISLEYAYAQSVLFKIYGASVQETGHKTRGHTCLTEDDREYGKTGKGSLLYGELLPRGSNKAFCRKRLAVEYANVLFDLGMGTGKILIQAFIQFRNLQYVYGVELSFGRYCLAEEAAIRMMQVLGPENFSYEINPGKYIIITELPPEGERSRTRGSGSSPDDMGNGDITETSMGRVLHLEYGDMFNVTNLEIADIIMLETDIPAELLPQLCRLLDTMVEGARTLTYLDLRKVWSHGNFPFRQLESNKHLSDRFPTSWSVQRGHHFFLWVKIMKPQPLKSDDQRNMLLNHGNGDSRVLGGYARTNSGTLHSSPQAALLESSGHNCKSPQRILINSTENGCDESEMPMSPGKCLPFTLFPSLNWKKKSNSPIRNKSSRDHRDGVDERVVIPLNSDGTRTDGDATYYNMEYVRQDITTQNRIIRQAILNSKTHQPPVDEGSQRVCSTNPNSPRNETDAVVGTGTGTGTVTGSGAEAAAKLKPISSPRGSKRDRKASRGRRHNSSNSVDSQNNLIANDQESDNNSSPGGATGDPSRQAFSGDQLINSPRDLGPDKESDEMVVNTASSSPISSPKASPRPLLFQTSPDYDAGKSAAATQTGVDGIASAPPVYFETTINVSMSKYSSDIVAAPTISIDPVGSLDAPVTSERLTSAPQLSIVPNRIAGEQGTECFATSSNAIEEIVDHVTQADARVEESIKSSKVSGLPIDKQNSQSNLSHGSMDSPVRIKSPVVSPSKCVSSDSKRDPTSCIIN